MDNSILDRLKKESTPLIDGDCATFIWKGRSAPDLVGDFTGWEEGEPVRLTRQGRSLWTYELKLPADAYIEYAFKEEEENLADPFNRRLTSNGSGGYNNYFNMPEYQPTDLVHRNRHIQHGIIRHFTLDSDYVLTGDERMVHLFQPAASGPFPLLVVWDGQDYLKRARLNYIVDNLIARHRMRPIAMAFVDNGGEDTRTFEYACNDATLTFLMKLVLPLATSELDLLDIRTHPGEFGVLGSSMSGLMALYTGARFPHIFGKVFSQSGAFSMGGLEMVVFDLLERGEFRPLKIWLDVGMFDLPGLLETNRRMRDMLVRRGNSLLYREYNAGHNLPSWRDDVWRGLEALYGFNL